MNQNNNAVNKNVFLMHCWSTFRESRKAMDLSVEFVVVQLVIFSFCLAFNLWDSVYPFASAHFSNSCASSSFWEKFLTDYAYVIDAALRWLHHACLFFTTIESLKVKRKQIFDGTSWVCSTFQELENQPRSRYFRSLWYTIGFMDHESISKWEAEIPDVRCAAIWVC